MFASVLVAFLAGAAAQAETTAQSAAGSAAPVVKERKICRKTEPATGSMTTKRVCKTKAEWEGLTVPAKTPPTPPRPAPGSGQSND